MPVVAQLAQLAQIVLGRDIDPAFALDRLDQHRDDVVARVGQMPQGLDVAVGHADKTLHQRLETGLRAAVAGGRQGREGAAVEAVFHDDDVR